MNPLPTSRRLPFTPVCVGLALVVAWILSSLPALATGTAPDTTPVTGPHWGPMLMQLFGGLALFLFGMEQMSDGLKSAAGAKMKDILARFTTNRVKAAMTGGIVTAIIQSSSVTTVLVVGFVSAGLMSLTQSVGVIMGANVGSTFTAQLIAFKVDAASLLFIAAGFTLLFIGKRDRIKQAGNMIMGLGLIFFGMAIMSEGMSPLRSYEPFIGFMAGMENPALGILTGALFTALIQSSAATTGIVIALASQGLLPLPAGIALIFGANIGTCATALLATFGKSREALRVALVHVIFNVVGVLLWVAFIPHLTTLVELISPKSADLENTAKLASEVPRQVANAHAIFNITNTLLLLPFARLIANLARRLAPDVLEQPLVTPKFLDRDAFKVPSLALQNARLETARLGEKVSIIMHALPRALLAESGSGLNLIASADDVPDTLEADILRYLGELRKVDLTDEESQIFRHIMRSTDALETIADIVTEEIVELGRRRIATGLRASDTMHDIVDNFYQLVSSALDDTVRALRDDDIELAKDVIGRRHQIREISHVAYRHQESRFHSSDGDRLETFRLEMALVECLRRIYTHTKRIARTIADE